MVKDKASSYLLDKYRVMEGMEEQRKILERKLPAILDIIQDAEEKGAFRPGVGVWLKDLKTVSYEANDVFDEFNYEALRREAQKKGHHRIKALTSFPARNPIVSRYRMGKKLRKFVQAFEVLVTEMNKFEFRHIQRAPPSKQWRETDPIMVDSDKDIISRSRDEEKKKIMRMLLDEACSKDLTVLPIVGMGGLGKTTFVQLIYNDSAIQKHFELRRWCCVSHDFDAANIANNICQTNVNGNRGREKAFQDLQSLITGKRYLIVLDDVWDPDDDKWGKLKTCLNHGDKGSVVLTTTRNEKIARKMVMGVAEAYNIEKLSDEHLKEIIENRAFSSQKPNHCELDKIVDKIVDSCSSIGELRNLNDLGGELELCCLENATEAHAKEANLGNKEKLTHLSLAWDDKGQEGLVQDCHKKVLYALKPHDGLQMLRIVNYKGTSFPTWITYLSNLTELHLTGCILCKEFPPFCHFKDLQALCLEKLDKLQSLCGDMTFLALKELQLHDLESLARWVATEGKEVMFPVLEKLDIKSCPKLTSLPEAPNLKDIKLDEGKAMLSLELVVKSRHYIPSLSILKLAISDREDVTRPQIDQDHESSLSELMLKGCNFFFSYNPTQPTFGAWKWFGKLASLEISDCHALKYWPEDVFESLVWLENLTISSCDKLIGCTPVRGGDPTQTTDQFLPHINMISIENCGILEELFILPQSLRYLDITGCPRLEFIWGKEEHRETDAIQLEYCRDLLSTSIQEQSPSPRNHHPCLEYLELSDCDNLEVLPNLPPSLRYLCIECCNKLCSLSGHLNLLDTLDIYGCGKLQSFDSLGDLPSLEVLTLESCQCLTSLPGVLGSYSALQTLTVKYCQSIDLTPLYKRHQQRLNSLELKDISHANSSNPYEGTF
ncbi:hypothetical protein PR202_ga22737 [Eleusine coracana subsp. coracana]|uniref:Uncharacterized protein n=1 Tax=Eleusine coracana subsp. coracana TaxID=191504 RepID=A0AAV5D3G8_ELECO|nr:hypothetical protein PR202_ga22737 [Eleusine coracana subsp. coracana]